MADGLTNRLPDSTIPVISFVPYQKSKRFFHIFIFYLNSPNHALHSCVLLGVLLMGKSYCRGIFKVRGGSEIYFGHFLINLESCNW